MRSRRRQDLPERDPTAESANGQERGPTPGATAAAAEAGAELALAADRIGEVISATREIAAALDRARLRGLPHPRIAGSEKLLGMLSERTRQLGSEAQELGARVGAARRQLGVHQVPRTPRPDASRDSAANFQPAERPRATPSEGIRIVIAQMNAAGSSPLEIEEHLRDDLGLLDARSVVADVLGPERRQGAGP